jgi:hypothetical protein
MSVTDSTTEILGTYLDDHLVGANSGVQMAQQLRERAGDGPDAGVLGVLVEDIKADRDELRGLLERLDQSSNRVKGAAGWIAGKAHQVAVAEALTGDAHLSMLLHTESLTLGIDGKRALWVALLTVASRYPVLTETDLTGLAERARDQRDRLESVRLRAANRAFTLTADPQRGYR